MQPLVSGPYSRLVAMIALMLLLRGDEAPERAQVIPLDKWTLVYPRAAVGRYEDFAFPDSVHGWVVSASGFILHTADGGRTWTEQAKGMPGLRSIDFLSATHGFAGTLDGRLYETTNGGATWKDVTDSLPVTAKGFCGIAHVGQEVHVVGRYNLSAADYFYSPDAGATWRHTSLKTLARGLVEVVFLDKNVGFIGGMSNKNLSGSGPAIILKTSDGGRHWRTVFEHSGERGFVWKIFPISRTLIYASLQSQDGIARIAKTTDGGEKWDTLTVATGQPLGPGLQSVGFLNDTVGFAAGLHRALWATVDGGRTWTRLPLELGHVNRFEKVGKTLMTAGAKGIYRFDGVR